MQNTIDIGKMRKILRDCISPERVEGILWQNIRIQEGLGLVRNTEYPSIKPSFPGSNLRRRLGNCAQD